MDEVTRRAYILMEALAKKGSTYPVDDIKEILEIIKGIPLKLIITNVPREVYTHAAAKEAFESLFKGFDNRSTFHYLPSFNRAQVYVTRPEAALLARLQTQGWTIPNEILESLCTEGESGQDSFECPVAQPGGINCFIAQSGDIRLSGEDDAEASGDDEECDEVENESGEEESERAEVCIEQSEGPSAHNADESVKEDSMANTIPPTASGFSSFPTTFVLDSVSSSGSVGANSRQIPPPTRVVGRPDYESTSEASGDDDTAVVSTIASVNSVLQPFEPHLSSHRSGTIKKREARRRRRNMHHLAPPLPSRQFLLSPPASPPVGWEPRPECQPIINYELLQALASLTPGETYELHPSDQENRHPSILVTPCESATAPAQRLRIVQTKCPERTN